MALSQRLEMRQSQALVLTPQLLQAIKLLQLSSLDLLRRLAARGHTVLAALHDLGLAAAHADHVVVLQDGRVVASGAPHDVLEPGLIRAVWGVDAEVLEHPVTGRPLIAYSGVAGDRSDQRMPRARPVAAGHPEA